MKRSLRITLLLSLSALGLAFAQDAARVNLNDMTEEALLATIPDFSERMVHEFFEYQPYVSVQQCQQELVNTSARSRSRSYEQYVFVPIDVNNADAETVMQLPGVDEAAAAALLESRPYSSNEAFLARLAELAPDADPEVAPSYLVAAP